MALRSKKKKPLGLNQAMKELKKGVQLPKVVEGEQRHISPKRTQEEYDRLADHQRAKKFVEVTLQGSKGQTYHVVVPASYVQLIPKKWEWTEERYRVAELVASGVPFTQIVEDPRVNFKSRLVIYAMLEHPEFREHVDGLIMETGWASRRERLASLQRLNQELLNKVLRELDRMKLTDKNVGALLSAINMNAKLIAQEKGEFIEETKVTSDVTMSGSMVHLEAKVDEILASKTEEERRALEKEFDEIGDEIIRQLTGEK